MAQAGDGGQSGPLQLDPSPDPWRDRIMKRLSPVQQRQLLAAGQAFQKSVAAAQLAYSNALEGLAGPRVGGKRQPVHLKPSPDPWHGWVLVGLGLEQQGQFVRAELAFHHSVVAAQLEYLQTLEGLTDQLIG